MKASPTLNSPITKLAPTDPPKEVLSQARAAPGVACRSASWLRLVVSYFCPPGPKRTIFPPGKRQRRRRHCWRPGAARPPHDRRDDRGYRPDRGHHQRSGVGRSGNAIGVPLSERQSRRAASVIRCSHAVLPGSPSKRFRDGKIDPGTGVARCVWSLGRDTKDALGWSDQASGRLRPDPSSVTWATARRRGANGEVPGAARCQQRFSHVSQRSGGL